MMGLPGETAEAPVKPFKNFTVVGIEFRMKKGNNIPIS
jgi:hypothetical protein